MPISFLNASLEYSATHLPLPLPELLLHVLCLYVLRASCRKGLSSMVGVVTINWFFVADSCAITLLWRKLCRCCCSGRHFAATSLWVSRPHADSWGCVMAPFLRILCYVHSGRYFAVVSFGWILCRHSLVISRWMLCHCGFISFVGTFILMYFYFAGILLDRFKVCGGGSLSNVFLVVLLSRLQIIFSVVM